ncbi:MAG: alpha/beta hydrolase [Bacteroidetes bacterium]|nr:MAG: alpha/beta hydrolase [Bacteroidota bacterium]
MSVKNKRKHTALPNVRLLSESFYMPQLKRKRQVWIYLPQNYEHTRQSYPVLYIQDGQNVFDEATAFAGEWEVDESLHAFEEVGDPGIIVVAIANGGDERINEYAPWVHPKIGGGQGSQYVDFLVHTLKPYIDQHFRTLPQREFTGIMGSSMGGLISLYAGLKYPQVFGRWGIFSPSLWFSDHIFSYLSDSTPLPHPRIYLLAGALESKSIVANTQRLYRMLLEQGLPPQAIQYCLRQDGKHSEWFWAREFLEAYSWLYRDFRILPLQNSIPWDELDPQQSALMELIGQGGRRQRLETAPFTCFQNPSKLKKGSYLAKFYQNQQLRKFPLVVE